MKLLVARLSEQFDDANRRIIVKLTTKKLRQLIREELSKVTESFQDGAGSLSGGGSLPSGQRSGTKGIRGTQGLTRKIVSGTYGGEPYSIEIDPRQSYYDGNKVNTMNPRILFMILKSQDRNGKVFGVDQMSRFGRDGQETGDIYSQSDIKDYLRSQEGTRIMKNHPAAM